MTETLLVLLLGLVVLSKSANVFVDSAVSVAYHFRIHPMVVGMVVLGFATAMPEMVVSALAASKGQLGLSVGNAVGSSIANIGLVIGGAAMVVPLSVYSQMIRYEYPALVLSMLLVTALVWDRSLDFSDGLVLLLGFMVLIFWLVSLAKKRSHQQGALDWQKDHPPLSQKKMLLYFIIGIVGLLLGSELLIHGATRLAKFIGMSDFMIGLTVVAIGTSLPELASSLVAAKRGQHDIAVGNVIGSNLFNMLIVLAMPALIFPGPIPEVLISRDIPVMFLMTVLMFFVSYGLKRSRYVISRLEGLFLLLMFLLYTIGLALWW